VSSQRILIKSSISDFTHADGRTDKHDEANRALFATYANVQAYMHFTTQTNTPSTNKLQIMELLCICATLVPSVLGAAANSTLHASGFEICRAAKLLTVASNLLTCGIKHPTGTVHDSTSLEDKDRFFFSIRPNNKLLLIASPKLILEK